MIEDLIKIIRINKNKDNKKSYTSFLINGGLNKCIGKMQEEFDEFKVALNKNENEIHEAADLIYHFLVTLEAANIKFEDVLIELKKRTKESGISEKKNR
tara:strand:- start:132 stop:428 length:297 start_codon:yes stop_codon:yes gene_type:complete